MANDDMRNEIEILRAQVAELTAERKAKEKQAQVSNGLAPTTKSADDEVGSTGPEAANFTSQFQELVDTIDEELKEAGPVRVLLVFALGVLIGRLLPR